MKLDVPVVLLPVVLLAATASAQSTSPGDVRVLQRDELVAPLQMPAGTHRLFAIDVPADVRDLEVRLLGASPIGSDAASGSAVLSVKASRLPTHAQSDCRAEAPNVQATCSVPNPGVATRHYIRVDARTAVRGGTLVAKWRDSAPVDDERYDAWYRSITPDTWVSQGANPSRVARVLARIERSRAPRRDATQPDTVMAYGFGHWVFEWRHAGDEALRDARRAHHLGRRDAAKAAYLEAIHYYNIASYPHLNEDTHGIAALEASQAAYREAAPLLKGTFRPVEMALGGIPFRAHLHVPEGKGPFPLLIKSGGSDIVKEIFYASWERALAPRGIAVLLLDMPGIGDSRAHVLTPDSDKLHVAALEHLKRHGKALDPRLDTARIAVEGASFGGHAAGRFFLRHGHQATAVVAVCGPQDQIFRKPAFVYAAMPRMTIDGVRSRLGLAPGASWEVFAQKMHSFALGSTGQGLLPPPVPLPVPLLAIGTIFDPVAPLDDVVMLADAANNADLRIFDVMGHCPDRRARDAIIADWLVQQFRKH
jgi:esterase FrsA